MPAGASVDCRGATVRVTAGLSCPDDSDAGSAVKNVLRALALTVIVLGIVLAAFTFLSWQGGATCCPPIGHPSQSVSSG